MIPSNPCVNALVLIATLFGLTACDNTANNQNKFKLVELKNENLNLESKLEHASRVISEMQNTQYGNIRELVVTEPAKFKDSGNTLEDVKDRKRLRCGGNADLPGFGYLSPDDSQFSGFDIDICRGIAAATLGTQGADLYEVIPLTSRLRFSALQSGQVDVLTRNTTWTLSRDSEFRANYAGITFYDGQGVLVRNDSEFNRISELEKQSICVQEGSTSALNIAAYFKSLDKQVEISAHLDRVAALESYDKGICEAYTADKTSLMVQKVLLSEPNEHHLLEGDISREPLGPVVRHGDDNWRDIVFWTVQCMLNAELYGISIENVDNFLETEDSAIALLLGIEGKLGEKLGLSSDFCYQVVKQVGNYEDIYERHLGYKSKFSFPRTTNALYTDGGLFYPLPFR
ncbi:MAG: amino acid ABC transporter substrate-binding protein [Granulosicoccus sp.]|nr:amino acid ABC transporter substrate-binding protein [Granulosicoccus sp.]